MQLVISFQDACKPFDEDSDEVVIIDTREVIPDTEARSIMSAHGEGQQQHSPAARGGNLAKILPNQVIADFGRGSSVESESE